jgi:uncharacterized membrane protein
MSSQVQLASIGDSKQHGEKESDVVPQSEDATVLNASVKLWSLRIFAYILSLGILTVQLGQSPIILNVCLSLCVITLVALQFGSPKKCKYHGKRPTPFSFEHFLSEDAATFLSALAYSQIVLNVLWALRWFAGVYNIATGLYGIKQEDIDTLNTCAAEHPNNMFGAPVCNVLASFLQRPYWLYCHAAGAITALALGPFQISEQFRTSYVYLHKILGYLYTIAVFIGGIGACGLIATSKTGGVAASGFIALLILWWSTLSVGIYHARNKDIDQHHIWMIRNYTFTFSAVPFRFMPGIFIAFGLDPLVAYPIGTWLTVLISWAWCEYFIRFFVLKNKPLAGADANNV